MPSPRIPCPSCGTPMRNESKLCLRCTNAKVRRSAPSVAEDRERQRQQDASRTLKAKYDEALKTIERQERDLRAMGVLRDVDTFEIAPRKGEGASEGTVVVVASDWHVEENVGAEVGDLNRYNIEIARQRATTFFQAAHRLTTLLQQDIRIDNMVLALLGDFISNDIHEEIAEVAEQAPMHALTTAQSFLISGIQFLLNHTKLTFTIPCHSGNHGRTTKTTRFATENGHSLEYLMYGHLAAYFRHEPRVTFLIPEGYHSYVKVYDQILRFHHGHAIRYGGGVGGIYIPTHKAIAAWNRAKRADLDVFGHFHQQVDGGSFLCNGSLIGYNAYALSIKASYEPPKQSLFLLDKRRGRTCSWPILFETAQAVARKKAA